MKNRLRLFCAALVLLFAPVPNGFAANAWEYTRLIQTADSGQKPAAVELDGKVFDSAQESLADLRITSLNHEIPYMITSQPEISNRVKVPSKVVSRETRERETLIVLDLGDQESYNEINLVPKRSNFFRKITLEGSADNASWKVIRKGMPVYDLNFEEKTSYLANYTNEVYEGYSLGRYTSRSLSFEFPAAGYRYVRVTVPHDQDKEPVELENVEVFKTRKINAFESTYNGTVVKREVSPDAKSVELTVDFGSKNLPISRIELESPSGNFARKIEILSGNDMKEWKEAGEGTIFSVSIDGSDSSSKTIRFPENRARYLKLRVYHGDNKPIKISKVTGFGLKKFAVFIPAANNKYSLSYGNPSAAAPAYDVAAVLRNTTLPDFAAAGLSEETKNADFSPVAESKPWTEGHPYLLWTAMGVVILGLIGLAAQVVKKTDEK